MRQLAGCKDGDCEKVFDPEDGTDDLVIQGYELSAAVRAQLGSLPTGEGALRVSRALLHEAVRGQAGVP